MGQLKIGDRRQVKKLPTITIDMWGKTGMITEVNEHPRESSWRKLPTKYFLKFWVPNRCAGLWLTEQQMEEVS